MFVLKIEKNKELRVTFGMFEDVDFDTLFLEILESLILYSSILYDISYRGQIIVETPDAEIELLVTDC